MFTWIILFICGIPVVVAINQAIKQQQFRESQLKRVQDKLAEKERKKAEELRLSIEEKRKKIEAKSAIREKTES